MTANDTTLSSMMIELYENYTGNHFNLCKVNTPQTLASYWY